MRWERTGYEQAFASEQHGWRARRFPLALGYPFRSYRPAIRTLLGDPDHHAAGSCLTTPDSPSRSGATFPGGFSVLMAVYGRDDPELFRRAVQSVFDNTLRPERLVVVVDGPIPPALESVLGSFGTQPALHVHRLPQNRGLARALNAGLDIVRTQWVLRADADDTSVPDRFERQAAAVRLHDDQLDLFGGAILETSQTGEAIALRTVPQEPGDIASRIRFRNPFNHMTVAFRRDRALKVGGYPDIFLREDYALWAAMLADGARCINLPEVLVHATAGRHMYRRRGGLRYAHAEWDLQRHLVRTGHVSPLASLVVGLGRMLGFMLPSALRGYAYEMLLRRRP